MQVSQLTFTFSKPAMDTAENTVFHLISWFGNFAERHSFRIVLGDLPETMRKLCLSAKFSQQQIR